MRINDRIVSSSSMIHIYQSQIALLRSDAFFIFLFFLLLAESNLIYFGALAARRHGLVLNQHSQPSEGRERERERKHEPLLSGRAGAYGACLRRYSKRHAAVKGDNFTTRLVG